MLQGSNGDLSSWLTSHFILIMQSMLVVLCLQFPPCSVHFFSSSTLSTPICSLLLFMYSTVCLLSAVLFFVSCMGHCCVLYTPVPFLSCLPLCLLSTTLSCRYNSYRSRHLVRFSRQSIPLTHSTNHPPTHWCQAR